MRLPARLLRRKTKAHKGDFGHVFVLAGSFKYSGAALLCATAAMRSGSGLLTLGVPEGLKTALIKIKPLEAMLLPLAQTGEGSLSISAYAKIRCFMEKADVVVVGPGLSDNRSSLALARKIIKNTDKPLLIDADGLNALAGHLDILLSSPSRRAEAIDYRQSTIMTPHAGEFSRLSGLSIKKIESDRAGAARKFVRKHKITLVLKGSNTVVADYKGKIYINKTGNPGMATAGSGDVLAGIIAAFLGQGLNAFDSAKYAVYIHGLAGDLAAKDKTEISVVASDIITYIPQAIKRSS